MKKKYEDPVFGIERFQFTNDLIMGSDAENPVDDAFGDGDDLFKGEDLDVG